MPPDVTPDAYAIARRKAKYGHRDWLAWTRRDGQKCAARVTTAAVKQAMLDCGTQQFFMRYAGSDGMGMIATWRLGALWIRQAKRGMW